MRFIAHLRLRPDSRVGAVLALTALAATMLASSAGSATSTKWYVISQLSPNPVQAGQSVTFTITNCGSDTLSCNGNVSTQTLGSANVTIGDATTLTQGDISSNQISVSNPSKHWTGSIAGNVVQLRANVSANALAPGESVTVTFAGPTAAGSYTTTSRVKQSNDFKGPPGNDFTRVGSEPDPLVVTPAAPAILTFTNQPRPTEVNQVINALLSTTGVRVRVQDQFGNSVVGASVSIELCTNSSGPPCTDASYPGGNLTGTTTRTADATGVANFDDLRIDTVAVGYKLLGTSPSAASAASAAFFIASKVQACNGASCSPDPATTSTTTISETVTGASGNLLAIALADSIGIPNGVCGTTFTPVGSGIEFVAVPQSGGSTAGTPTWTISAKVSKTAPGFDPARGAALWNVCLGTVNISAGTHDSGCASTSAESWPDKAVSGDTAPCAEYDSTTQKFWGVVPDAAPNVKKCSQTSFPVVLSKTKTSSGDLLITFCVPYPWDGGGHMG